MMIDAHLHVWSSDAARYPWNPIGGYVPDQPAPIEVFITQMQSAGVEKAVVVQPTPYGWDNSYLLDACKAKPEVFKAVVLVDPQSADNADELAELVEKGASGLRVNLHLCPPEISDSEYFMRLLQAADALAMPVCFQLTSEHLTLLEKLTLNFPRTKFILDHLARPEKGAKASDPQFQRLLGFSKYANVYVKLSGLNYYSVHSAPYMDTWPLLIATKDAFSPQRCIWGSDFPFVNDHWSYEEQIKIFQHEMGFSKNDLEWIMGKTAASIWWGS